MSNNRQMSCYICIGDIRSILAPTKVEDGVTANVNVVEVHGIVTGAHADSENPAYIQISQHGSIVTFAHLDVDPACDTLNGCGCFATDCGILAICIGQTGYYICIVFFASFDSDVIVEIVIRNV